MYFVNDRLVIDCLEFMQVYESLDENTLETVNDQTLSEYHNSGCLGVILPEVFNKRKLVPNSSAWALGMLIFYVFEVCSEAAFCSAAEERF